MAQLEVRFTIKGEQSEKTFFLRNEGKKFYLTGDSADSKKYEVQKDEFTNIFTLVDKNIFEEPSDVVEERMVGLSENWIEAQSQGLEAENEETQQSRKPGYGPKDIIVNPDNYSISDLIRMVENGDIEIAPRFQRNFVWDKTRQSRLIESIFLGLPLPAIYLSEYDDGRMTIVDGLQRISTIRDFMNDKLRLCNMEYFDYCNGRTFSELKLPNLQLRRFYRTQITCFKIDYRSPNQLKYDLFRRLNTGGKALNDQEIRNCLSRSHVQDALYNMISSEEFKSATCGSIKDTRMAAQESALRFICFYNLYTSGADLSGYDGNMSCILDSCVEELNEFSIQKLGKYVTLFKNSMSQAYSLFGEYAFRKVGSNYRNTRKSSINKSLMVAVSVLLAAHKEYGRLTTSRELTGKLAILLKKDRQLSDAISWSTSSRKSILYVFKCLKENLFDKFLLSNNG
ncbi:DUF262 domain-containing protein [uncultured Bacteroides sp.]|uniref:DUF262 domain-containing protein n=1 Tax=uncultured Bacteroides sp. TaxID=162156 RepID=UPI0025FFB335|nr:DUF262 domain-containing protein [uncultured Bacteroides sp.]